MTSDNNYSEPPLYYDQHFHESAERLRSIFAGRIFVGVDEVAGILSVEVKTVRALCNSGRIDCVVLGTGHARPRRRFALEHVLAFLRKPTSVGTKEVGTIDADRVRAAVRRRVAAYGSKQ